MEVSDWEEQLQKAYRQGKADVAVYLLKSIVVGFILGIVLTVLF